MDSGSSKAESSFAGRAGHVRAIRKGPCSGLPLRFRNFQYRLKERRQQGPQPWPGEEGGWETQARSSPRPSLPPTHPACSPVLEEIQRALDLSNSVENTHSARIVYRPQRHCRGLRRASSRGVGRASSRGAGRASCRGAGGAHGGTLCRVGGGRYCGAQSGRSCRLWFSCGGGWRPWVRLRAGT